MTNNFQYVSEELKRMIEPAASCSHRFDEALNVRVQSDAYVAPYVDWDRSIGCVLDSNGNVVKDSECQEWKEDGGYYNIHQSKTENKDAIFLGFIVTVFGHSFTDDLRKLWFVDTPLFKSLVADGVEVVYTTSWNLPLPDAVREIMIRSGYDISKARHISKLTHFNRIYIPDNCVKETPHGRVYSKEYEQIINCIKNSFIDIGGRVCDKVYFTRSKYSAGSGKEYGESSIERVFAHLGYVIVAPEELSITEQIYMVRSCHFFAATEGSVAHLSLFCNPGTNVCIVNKVNYLNFHQVMINEFADLNVTYIEAHHSSRADLNHPWWGPFYLCVTKYLERFAGRRFFHMPYWLCFSYWAYTRNVLYRMFNRGRKILRSMFSKR